MEDTSHISFYVGLVYYYRGDTRQWHEGYLQRVVEHAEQQG